MRSKLLNTTYWYDLCSEVFDNTTMKINRAYMEFGWENIFSGNHTILANGGEDPWQWATKRDSDSTLNQVSLISDCDDCGHCAELYTPKDSDPLELKGTRIKIKSIIYNRLMEFKEE